MRQTIGQSTIGKYTLIALPELTTCRYDAAIHLAPCLDIWYRASLAGHPFLRPDEVAADLPLVRDVYFPRAEITVVEKKGVVAGFIALLGSHIGALFVDPEQHRAGIGRLLILKAIALRGSLTVEVYEQNLKAMAFYKACGFERTGWKASDDQGRPHPLIVMARSDGRD